jgi:hypothetical protein
MTMSKYVEADLGWAVGSLFGRARPAGDQECGRCGFDDRSHNVCNVSAVESLVLPFGPRIPIRDVGMSPVDSRLVLVGQRFPRSFSTGLDINSVRKRRSFHNVSDDCGRRLTLCRRERGFDCLVARNMADTALSVFRHRPCFYRILAYQHAGCEIPCMLFSLFPGSLYHLSVGLESYKYKLFPSPSA